MLILFFVLDAAYLGANLTKIPDGGWVPLMMGVLIFTLLTTWSKGRALMRQNMAEGTIPIEVFAKSAHSSAARVPGTAVFMTPNPEVVPHALLHSLKHYKALHEQVIILSVQVFDVPYVPQVDRVEVHRLEGSFSQVIVQYGFKDESDIPAALALCAEAGLEIDMMDTSFFLGRETLIPKLGSEMAYWRSLIFVAMFRNAGSATAFFKIPSNRVVELGSQIVL